MGAIQPDVPAPAVALGTEAAAAAAPAVGTVGSSAVVPAVEKVPDAEDPATKAPSDRPKQKEPKSVTFVDAKKVAQIKPKDGDFIVLAGEKAFLQANMKLQVVGEEVKGETRNLLGHAVVERVANRRSVLFLDPAASKAKGLRFLVLPMEPAGTAAPEAAVQPAPAPAPEEPAEPAVNKTPVLQGGIKLENKLVSALRTITLNNTGDAVWTGCKVVLPGKRVMMVGMIRRAQPRSVMVRNFTMDPEADQVDRGKVLVTCAEGKREFMLDL
jgi:hypothetical protein